MIKSLLNKRCLSFGVTAANNHSNINKGECFSVRNGHRMAWLSTSSSSSSSLVDNFGRQHNYLRISLTERCNLRCDYCMPPEGVELKPDSELLTTDELLRAVQVFVQLGVSKVRLTGGEPLVRKDIISIVEKIRSMGISNLGLTTNGILFSRHAKALKAAGLSHVNISLDTLDANRFRRITHRNGHEKVMSAVRAASELFDKVKINCVIKRGVNEDEITSFVAMTRHEKLEVRFLEFMPFGKNGWENKEVVTGEEMLNIVRSVYPLTEPVPDENGPNPTAKLFKVPDFMGRIGFITAMSDEFCSTCNRLRLTADG